VLVVLDTNILVSALLFRGKASVLHRAWVEASFSLAVTEAMVEEYRRVLSYEKFRLSKFEVEYLLSEEVLPFSTLIEGSPACSHWIDDDPDDDEFINAALDQRVDYLVSGDSHILDRKAELPCRVLTLAELVALC